MTSTPRTWYFPLTPEMGMTLEIFCSSRREEWYSYHIHIEYGFLTLVGFSRY